MTANSVSVTKHFLLSLVGFSTRRLLQKTSHEVKKYTQGLYQQLDVEKIAFHCLKRKFSSIMTF